MVLDVSQMRGIRAERTSFWASVVLPADRRVSCKRVKSSQTQTEHAGHALWQRLQKPQIHPSKSNKHTLTATSRPSGSMLPDYAASTEGLYLLYPVSRWACGDSIEIFLHGGEWGYCLRLSLFFVKQSGAESREQRRWGVVCRRMVGSGVLEGRGLDMVRYAKEKGCA